GDNRAAIVTADLEDAVFDAHLAFGLPVFRRFAIEEPLPVLDPVPHGFVVCVPRSSPCQSWPRALMVLSFLCSSSHSSAFSWAAWRVSLSRNPSMPYWASVSGWFLNISAIGKPKSAAR